MNIQELKYVFSFFSSVSPSENSDYAPNPSRSERLILDVQPSHPGLLNYSPYENVCKISGSSTDFQKKARDKVIIFTPI